MFRLDTQSILFASGVLYASMPLTVWVILFRRHSRPNLDLWCISGLFIAAGLVLLGLRGIVPDWLSIAVANGLTYLASAIKIIVLRMEAGRPSRWLMVCLGWLLAAGLLVIALQLGVMGRTAITTAGYAIYAAAQAWAAAQLARARGSRSATLMSVLFALMALAASVRSFRVIIGSTNGVALSNEFDTVVLAATGLLAMVFANIGYLGLALDRMRASAAQQQQAMDRLRETQHALEAASRTREAVANERARTTRLLAHEVRQPLHNAAVALQSGVATLARSPDPGEATQAILQAQAVIRRVSATLDNTVAATMLLTGQGRVSTGDTDLQMLIDLCLGDLPPEARARIRIEYQADARSARLEPSLVRLALRNLLMNATLYAPSDTPVILRVLDSDEPLALVLEVADLGPGISDDLRERVFDEGTRGSQPTVPGYGLGLHVVKRVATLHGGSIEWLANQPQGSIFRLILPQGDPT
jgi:signal transduction histidine kinase